MRCFLFVVLCSLPFLSVSQQVKRSYAASRTSAAPKIDGDLSDSAWVNVPVADGFIALEPKPGLPASHRTEVKLIYDNSAVYVSACMFDTSPDSICRELGARDAGGINADWFGLTFDTYYDGQNAFGFFVYASGVQQDVKFSPDNDDGSWNAVWESKVLIHDKGWNVEIRIPYSAIRFPKKDEQKWMVNFARTIRRSREFSLWNPIDPKVDGFLTQSGDLTGVKGIESPLRLSFSPYVSAYVENYPYDIPGKSNTSYSFNGGMDLKYGISESFTLDLTLVPDFGQVQSDNKVLNLTPYEVRYDERRQFFTEGTELFNKAGLFYSRRVGEEPMGYYSAEGQLDSNEVLDDNPANSQLINATKISGRTKGGLGIGIFNATTTSMNATFRDTLTGDTRKLLTQPLTNYSVIVLDQNLKNNSFISLVNTNVLRDGSAYDANVTGTQFRLLEKKRKWALQGTGAYSQKFFADSAAPSTGYRYRAGIGKVSGNYTFELVERVESETFDQNDLGYLDRNNRYSHYLLQAYETYEPFWVINSTSTEFNIIHDMLYSPRVFSLLTAGFATDVNFKNYFSVGVNAFTMPLDNYDYFEPRQEGRYYTYGPNNNVGGFFSSDYRKKFALDGNFSYRWYSEMGRRSSFYNLSPRYRFSNRFTLVYSFMDSYNSNEPGWVEDSGTDIIFGIRDVHTIENGLDGSFIFNCDMSLKARLRHYWSKAEYSSFFALSEDGKPEACAYNFNNDIDFSAFNIDLIYTWQFLPGSEMSIAWKNSIYTISQELAKKYSESLQGTLASPQTNSFSIKLLYYLDYQKLKRGS